MVEKCGVGKHEKYCNLKRNKVTAITYTHKDLCNTIRSGMLPLLFSEFNVTCSSSLDLFLLSNYFSRLASS